MNLQKNWELKIDQSVYKIVNKLPQHDAEAISRIIRSLSQNPYFGDLQKMQGEENTWRRRVGVYRIFFKIAIPQHEVIVFRVVRRTSKTY